MAIIFSAEDNKTRYIKDLNILSMLLTEADKIFRDERACLKNKANDYDEIRIQALLKCHERKLFVLRYGKVAADMKDVFTRLFRYLNKMLDKISEDKKPLLLQTIEKIQALLVDLKRKDDKTTLFNTELQYSYYQRILPIMRAAISLWGDAIMKAEVLQNSDAVSTSPVSSQPVTQRRARARAVVVIQSGIKVLDAPIENRLNTYTN